jgi:hypothetical protein
MGIKGSLAEGWDRGSGYKKEGWDKGSGFIKKV